MIFPEKMNKINMHVLKGDVERVLKYLGSNLCIQLVLKDNKIKESTEFKVVQLNEYKSRIDRLISFTGIKIEREQKEYENYKLEMQKMDEEGLLRTADIILGLYKSVMDDEEEISRVKKNFLQTLEELETFKKLNVSFEELEHLSFLTYRLGKIPDTKYKDLTKALENRAVIIPLDEPGAILALATKKGRWALDSELKKVNYEEIAFPVDYKGLPSEIYKNIEEKVNIQNKKLSEIQEQKHVLNQGNAEKLFALLEVIEQKEELNIIKSRLVSTKNVYVITGWIPNKEINKTIAELDTITLGKIAVNILNPEEIPEVKKGTEKVPVKLKNSRITKAFEGLILAYGSPLYGTINPVPFVAFFFVLLFSIMFGDMGQGFVGVIIGILLLKLKIKSLEKIKKLGTIFIVVGIACMVTGFLYGSVFTNEEILRPVTRAVTGLFGNPVDHIVTIMPTHGAEKIFMFFGFTIGIGVIINSIGLLINIVNKLKLKNFYEGIFGKTGLCGALFFWYVVFIAVKIIFGLVVYTYDIIIMSVPLALIFIKEPVYNIFSGKRPLLEHGFVSFFVEGVIEVIESVSYFLSNSISFVRVAAFALSHTVLSLIVFKISDLMLEVPGGIIGSIFIYILGNAVIILLEGLIVTIQVVRLQYYEFFSKFFSEVGVEFKPFILKV